MAAKSGVDVWPLNVSNRVELLESTLPNTVSGAAYISRRIGCCVVRRSFYRRRHDTKATLASPISAEHFQTSPLSRKSGLSVDHSNSTLFSDALGAILLSWLSAKGRETGAKPPNSNR